MKKANKNAIAANTIETAVVIETTESMVHEFIKTSAAAWEDCVGSLQGQFTTPVELLTETAIVYDMGKPVAPVTLLIGPTQPAAAATDSAAKPAARVTKSEAVRILIRAARTTGADADAVAAQAQRQLSMTKALAAVYVKNNWACI
jgi:hypothetical protein